MNLSSIGHNDLFTLAAIAATALPIPEAMDTDVPSISLERRRQRALESHFKGDQLAREGVFDKAKQRYLRAIQILLNSKGKEYSWDDAKENLTEGDFRNIVHTYECALKVSEGSSLSPSLTDFVRKCVEQVGGVFSKPMMKALAPAPEQYTNSNEIPTPIMLRIRLDRAASLPNSPIYRV